MKKILYILILLISTASFGQRKYAADRYYKEFAYKKAAELYESIHDKGDNSYLVLSRLADAQYFNFEFTKAEKNYAKLMKFHEKIASSKHLFRYSQVLKTNGKIAESDAWLLKLKGENTNDSRVKSLENNKDYFVEYSNTKKTYINIHNVSSNTKYSDFGGFIYNDELYFASTKPKAKSDKKLYKWNKQPFLNIYKAKQKNIVSKKMLDLEKSKMLEGLSSKYHESNIIITKKGKKAYFTRDNYDGRTLKGDEAQVSHLKIYSADKIGDLWGNVQELPFNSDAFSCGHPALSIDEETLYFVSDMPNGFGGTDIYKARILGDNNFGKPINLGKEINTESREMFPFIGTNNELYFSSNGHLGLGALDVFEAKYIDGKYTNPVNLGSPINSAFDDFSFVINKKHSHGFFSSNRKNGKGDDDIYSFIMYRCKEDIKGIVSDSRTGEPIANAVVQLMNPSGEVVSSLKTGRSGSYIFEQKDCEQKFVVVGSKEGYKNANEQAATLDVDQQDVVVNLKLQSLIVGNQIVINPIYFDFDLANIRTDAEYELEDIVSVMNTYPELIIKIESHTDSRGSKNYNRNLSDRRAKSTRDYIISRGIASNRIESAIGFGEDDLLNHCDDANSKKCTEEEHQKNRRSYFYIVKGNESVKAVNE
ncbi:OmpA family protein [Tenacibaculum finnmarkense]|uniref:OmpA family protein n=1 Tax=Tenacibaculum finnmarkense TaxID=2781243 RepID=UPI00187B9CA1|nr:OmpA family protein [Tenacibaculum finnmarkense]MBE7661389.1 OmpA family protein [Tenacibaculum finnmarkense genomovar finnmarkense]MCG8253059.1 OmpA family protein [Tenacibaculum finnmarkense genomovar finnmarkense]